MERFNNVPVILKEKELLKEALQPAIDYLKEFYEKDKLSCTLDSVALYDKFIYRERLHVRVRCIASDGDDLYYRYIYIIRVSARKVIIQIHFDTTEIGGTNFTVGTISPSKFRRLKKGLSTW